MSAPAVDTLPPLPDQFGDTESADAMTRALDQLAESSASSAGGQPATADVGVVGASAAGGAPTTAQPEKKKRGRPSSAEKNPSPVQVQPAAVSGEPAAVASSAEEAGPLSKRAIREIPKSKLRKTTLRLNDELAAARAELEAAKAKEQERAAAAATLNPDVVAEALDGFVRNCVGMLDGAAQLGVGLLVDERLAPVVALDADEENGLVKPGQLVARKYLGTKVQYMPEIALGTAFVAVMMAKTIAVIAAARELKKSPGAVSAPHS